MEKETKDFSQTGEELIEEEVLESMVEELKEEAHQKEADKEATASLTKENTKESTGGFREQAVSFFHKLRETILNSLRTMKKAAARAEWKHATAMPGKIKEKGKRLASRIVKKEGTASHKDTLEKLKIFFVSDMDAEEVYLHEMSLKGLHFLKKKGIRYVFEKGEAKNYAYHLGYYEKDKRDGARYLKNYEEAGWSSIYHEKGEFDGIWHYFRLELAEGEDAVRIFSDRVSRTALYQRLQASWQTQIVMLIVCFLLMGGLFFFILTHDAVARELILLLCSLVMLLVAAAAALYVYIYHKISLRLEEFKYQ